MIFTTNNGALSEGKRNDPRIIPRDYRAARCNNIRKRRSQQNGTTTSLRVLFLATWRTGALAFK